MIKTVKIGDKEVTFRSSAAIPHMYRRRFGRDIFLDMDQLQKSMKQTKNGASTISVDTLEMFEDLAYCFAKHADPSVPEDSEEWLAGFEILDIYQIIPELIAMWGEENKTTSKAKKKSASSTET